MPQVIIPVVTAVVKFATSKAVVAVVGAAFKAAAVGAVVGAGTAAITGGDILKGAVSGAVIGGLTGGIGKAFSLASGVGKVGAGVEKVSAGLDTAKNIGTATENVASGVQAATQGGVQTVAAAAPNTALYAPTAAEMGSGFGGSSGGGLLSGVTGFLKNNKEIVGGILSKSAGSMLEARSKEKEIDALMENSRLNREANRVTDLQELGPQRVMGVQINGFKNKPLWKINEDGRIAGKVLAKKPAYSV